MDKFEYEGIVGKKVNDRHYQKAEAVYMALDVDKTIAAPMIFTLVEAALKKADAKRAEQLISWYRNRLEMLARYNTEHASKEKAIKETAGRATITGNDADALIELAIEVKRYQEAASTVMNQICDVQYELDELGVDRDSYE